MKIEAEATIGKKIESEAMIEMRVEAGLAIGKMTSIDMEVGLKI